MCVDSPPNDKIVRNFPSQLLLELFQLRLHTLVLPKGLLHAINHCPNVLWNTNVKIGTLLSYLPTSRLYFHKKTLSFGGKSLPTRSIRLKIYSRFTRAASILNYNEWKISTRTGRGRWGACQKAEICAEAGHSFWPKDERCYPRNSKGPCPEGQLLLAGSETVGGAASIGRCGCEYTDELARHYWSPTGTCHEHYTTGPCQERGGLFLPSGTCGCQTELPHYHNATNKCYQLGEFVFKMLFRPRASSYFTREWNLVKYGDTIVSPLQDAILIETFSRINNSGRKKIKIAARELENANPTDIFGKSPGWKRNNDRLGKFPKWSATKKKKKNLEKKDGVRWKTLRGSSTTYFSLKTIDGTTKQY